MLSLPSLAPQDSYTLWYNSSTSNNIPPFVEAIENSNDSQPRNQHASPHHRRHALHRSPLARLRHDEEYMERRKLNIQNYGSSWIKPPGVGKSLHQLREEEREMKEHQEALRREALAQELAEAEAEGLEEMLQGEGMDGDMAEARDLDDDVPDAETTGLEQDESENSDEENEVDEVPRGVLASRIPDDVYREAIVRGEEVRTNGLFGEEAALDEEDHSGMLQEEDLVHENADNQEHQDEDMDMDADLDADIPEAEEGVYEHTESEEELASSDDESVDAGRLPQQFATTTSMVRSDGTQNSMDLSSIISTDSSQVGGSSPRQRASLPGRQWRSSGQWQQ